MPAEGEGTVKEKAGAQLTSAGAKRAVLRTEADLFAALGLHEIPPELREGMGEIEAAERGELPRLVEAADLRGVFHNHTTASDGQNTLAEMAAAAQARGWEYLGIADHSKASFQANGLDEARLRRQIAEIAALNRSGRLHDPGLCRRRVRHPAGRPAGSRRGGAARARLRRRVGAFRA